VSDLSKSAARSERCDRVVRETLTTRECLALEVARSFTASGVIEILQYLFCGAWSAGTFAQ
jgi:hypothetical protein